MILILQTVPVISPVSVSLQVTHTHAMWHCMHPGQVHCTLYYYTYLCGLINDILSFVVYCCRLKSTSMQGRYITTSILHPLDPLDRRHLHHLVSDPGTCLPPDMEMLLVLSSCWRLYMYLMGRWWRWYHIVFTHLTKNLAAPYHTASCSIMQVELHWQIYAHWSLQNYSGYHSYLIQITLVLVLFFHSATIGSSVGNPHYMCIGTSIYTTNVNLLKWYFILLVAIALGRNMHLPTAHSICMSDTGNCMPL